MMAMTTRSNTRTAIAALLLAALTSWALADGMPDARVPKRSQHKAAPAPMTTAVQKSNGSGVAVQYRVDGTPQAGRATSVVLQFDDVTDPQGASVRFTADPGLTLRNGNPLTLPAGQRSTATVSVIGESDGLRYLNVFVSQGGASSAISIPIQTGTAPLMKSQGDVQTTKEGDSIITMPAK
jgi:hypothetical protein